MVRSVTIRNAVTQPGYIIIPTLVWSTIDGPLASDVKREISTFFFRGDRLQPPLATIIARNLNSHNFK